MKSPFDNYENIDDLFRRELKEYQAPPPKGVWDKINAQLPVKRNPFPLYVAASVFIAALLSTGWWSINPTRHYHEITSAKSVNAIKGNNNNVLKGISNNSVSPSENIATQSTFNGNNNRTVSSLSPSTVKQVNTSTVASERLNINARSLISNESTPVNLVSEQVNRLQPNVEQLQNIPGKPIASLMQPGLSELSYDNIAQYDNIVAPVTLSNRKIKGFYAGANGSASNVWILDHAALHDNNFDYQLTAGFSYGIQGGYNFSNNFGLETGITFNARDGQDYTLYVNPLVPVNKSVVLNYTEIPVLAKFKIPQISAFTGMPVVLNLNIGASYGYLRSSYTFVEGDKAGSQNQYPNNQLNALAGFSYDIYTNHPYSFSLGLMGEYGINTTENDNQVGSSTLSRYPNGSDFSRPHNLSVGINLAMNYNFSLFRR